MAERPKRNARKKLSAEEILEILEDYQGSSQFSTSKQWATVIFGKCGVCPLRFLQQVPVV